MDKNKLENAMRNIEAVLERMQADLKTHQQLQHDLNLFRQLYAYWLQHQGQSA